MQNIPSRLWENEKIKKLSGIFKNPKALMLLGLGAIILIFISSFTGGDKTETVTSDDVFSVQEYRAELESSVAMLVKSITGSDNVSVVVTLENGVEYTYADSVETDSANASGKESVQESSSETRSYITVRTADGGERALLVTEYMPQVRGVAIVCDGGNDKQTAEKIKGAVTAALDITSKRVYITGGN